MNGKELYHSMEFAVREKLCEHYPEETVAPKSEVCMACGLGGTLRVCLTCGYVGCCESLRGHNTAHARESLHPVIRSLPLSERSFTWCYSCNAYIG